MALCGRCSEATSMESARFAGQRAAQLPKDRLLCAACRQAGPAFAPAAAYGVSEDQLQQLLYLLKYEGMRSLARAQQESVELWNEDG
jgi:predicted amidophosphoribosyltransferase